MSILYSLPDAEYHARTELSSTGARRLLDSPARFRYWEDHQQPAKAAFDLGSAAHAKILGVGAGIIEYPAEHLTPSDNASTKAATVEWEQEQRSAGLIPVTPSDVRRVDAMAEAVLADRDARTVLESMDGREVTIVQEIDGVPVRARFDMYGGNWGADLKTARDASPRGFNRAVGTYGLHIQQQWYDDAHKAETGAHLGNFSFLVVESAPPHLVAVYDLDFMWMDVAKQKTKRARELWAECTATGVWPGYGATTLTAPTWAVYEADEEEIRV